MRCFVLDVDGQIVAWYAGAERIYGYSNDEALGQHLSLFHADPDDASNCPIRWPGLPAKVILVRKNGM